MFKIRNCCRCFFVSPLIDLPSFSLSLSLHPPIPLLQANEDAVAAAVFLLTAMAEMYYYPKCRLTVDASSSEEGGEPGSLGLYLLSLFASGKQDEPAWAERKEQWKMKLDRLRIGITVQSNN